MFTDTLITTLRDLGAPMHLIDATEITVWDGVPHEPGVLHLDKDCAWPDGATPRQVTVGELYDAALHTMCRGRTPPALAWVDEWYQLNSCLPKLSLLLGGAPAGAPQWDDVAWLHNLSHQVRLCRHWLRLAFDTTPAALTAWASSLVDSAAHVVTARKLLMRTDASWRPGPAAGRPDLWSYLLVPHPGGVAADTSEFRVALTVFSDYRPRWDRPAGGPAGQMFAVPRSLFGPGSAAAESRHELVWCGQVLPGDPGDLTQVALRLQGSAPPGDPMNDPVNALNAARAILAA